MLVPGALVEAVQVLRDHRLQQAQALQLDEGLVSRVGRDLGERARERPVGPPPAGRVEQERLQRAELLGRVLGPYAVPQGQLCVVCPLTAWVALVFGEACQERGRIGDRAGPQPLERRAQGVPTAPPRRQPTNRSSHGGRPTTPSYCSRPAGRPSLIEHARALGRRRAAVREAPCAQDSLSSPNCLGFMRRSAPPSS